MKQNFWDLVGVEFSPVEVKKKKTAYDSFNMKKHVMQQIRYAFLKSPIRGKVLSRAKVSAGMYKCNYCGLLKFRESVEVDHIIPVGSFDNWDGFISRVFPHIDGLQVLCIPCHLIKTKIDRKKN